jgi:hypothetical protein
VSKRLEILEGDAWQGFTQAPLAVLMLGKSDCAACGEWTRELEDFLATDERFRDVRFGKILLDQRGLVSFKRANPWIAELETLPWNVIFVKGERVKSWAGAGIDRLVTRLERAREGA